MYFRASLHTFSGIPLYTFHPRVEYVEMRKTRNFSPTTELCKILKKKFSLQSNLIFLQTLDFYYATWSHILRIRSELIKFSSFTWEMNLQKLQKKIWKLKKNYLTEKKNSGFHHPNTKEKPWSLISRLHFHFDKIMGRINNAASNTLIT